MDFQNCTYAEKCEYDNLLKREAEEFKISLIEKNRYFNDSAFMKRFREYMSTLGTSKNPFKLISLKKNSTLYRARIFKESFTEDRFSDSYVPQVPDFFGYNKSESFVPENRNYIPDGRANPRYIKYLYASDSKYTSLVEVRPSLTSHVSIAELLLSEPLVILDLSGDEPVPTDAFLRTVHEFFSTPCDGELQDYLPAQYITEYIKSLNNMNAINGVCYRSSLDKSGKNYTIFDFENIEVISSQIYKVCEIHFGAQCVSPYGHFNDLLFAKEFSFNFRSALSSATRYLNDD